MCTVVAIFISFLLPSISASAQQPPPLRDVLLDHLVGKWVLQGTIGGQETTHDVEAEWVLGHQYVRLHEVSREQDAKGVPAYEAIVFIGWDQPSGQYACLWLDSTGGGGIAAQAIGHGKRNGDEVEFVFKPSDGTSFHTRFAFTKGSDTWQWFMDGEEGGKLQPFARVVLKRR